MGFFECMPLVFTFCVTLCPLKLVHHTMSSWHMVIQLLDTTLVIVLDTLYLF
jgi:hypothetical protein